MLFLIRRKLLMHGWRHSTRWYKDYWLANIKKQMQGFLNTLWLLLENCPLICWNCQALDEPNRIPFEYLNILTQCYFKIFARSLRINRTVNWSLAKCISHCQQDWDPWLYLFLITYRSCLHKTTFSSTRVKIFMWAEIRLQIRGTLSQRWLSL